MYCKIKAGDVPVDIDSDKIGGFNPLALNSLLGSSIGNLPQRYR